MHECMHANTFKPINFIEYLTNNAYVHVVKYTN